jgi:hypothetical protein
MTHDQKSSSACEQVPRETFIHNPLGGVNTDYRLDKGRSERFDVLQRGQNIVQE